ncbi:MAG: UDP-N-acetylmuramoyl-L-alanyl-D-glutamate--2,6-diaminopimelate ligase [Dehalococcoidia bacterium]|nr:UDP-N-acetylmuramoyl-L-alanyl-D-glutamate--2,6-diaminopimelate ligase [Dehalococcoidia bacterium]
MLQTLRELIAGLPVRSVTGNPDTAIRSVVTDSRRVQPGDLFVALSGLQADGHHFIGAAVAAGAAVVVCLQPPEGGPLPACMVVVDDPAAAVGPIASAYFGHPSRRMRLIGVTGTDGKTTTTLLIAAILRAAGRRTAHFTTVEFHDGASARANRAGFTTPQAPELQGLLTEAAYGGATDAVLEVSSHALATGRVDGCEFDVAVFTNLAPEHLDYHATLDEYRAAKLRLFEQLRGPRHKPHEPVGVINLDDPSAAHFIAAAPAVRTWGLDGPGDVTARSIVLTPEGTDFILVTPQGETPIQTALLGRFNVRNWLAAATAALACGAGPEHVAAAAATVTPPPGRMERLPAHRAFTVYVDFAHTPQGLAAALATVEAVHPGRRPIAVFGHAGRRDTHHRRDLVSAAQQANARFVLTMDDPYDEDPAAILSEMRSAALELGCREDADFFCVLDRREAFAKAFALAGPGDAVLLAGRGHEQTIPLNGAEMPFHDATVAMELLG